VPCGCRATPVRHGPEIVGPFLEVTVDTKPGLSGLAADKTGRLWTVSERGLEVYRISLDAWFAPALERFQIVGIPLDTDLEALELVGDGQLAFGAERKTVGTASVLRATVRDHTIEVTRAMILPASLLGVAPQPNAGVEGLCGSAETLVAALESVGETAGRRWAPLVRIDGDHVVRVHRLLLTTATGKLSALDCRVAEDGAVTGWAIERHFTITRILRFSLPPLGQGDDEIVPVESLDLGPMLEGRLNLEGIAETPDGRVYAVVDNQWKVVNSPSALLVFAPNVLR
jgi:hypothetical protein